MILFCLHVIYLNKCNAALVRIFLTILFLITALLESNKIKIHRALIYSFVLGIPSC